MRTLALIPARAGSKGIPGKNIRDFAGKPLYLWAWDVGRFTCDDVLVTTDYEQLTVTRKIVRPERLCWDNTPMIAVVKHALQEVLDHPEWGMYPDVIVLLQPTQPLRKPEHVRAALKLLEETGADSVVSVVQIPAHYSPDYAMRTSYDITRDRYGLYPFLPDAYRIDVTRRQDARPAYSRDGTVYAIRRQTIEQGSLYGSHCVPLVIPSSESCTLDTEEDWQRAEAMVRS